MVLMVGRLSLKSLFGTDRPLSHRFMQINGYASRRILGPVGYDPTTLPLSHSEEYRKQRQYANVSSYGRDYPLMFVQTVWS